MRSEDRHIKFGHTGAPRRIAQNEPKQILLKSERCIAVLLYPYKSFPFFIYILIFFFSLFSLFFFFFPDCFETFFRGRLPAALIYESK